MEDITVTKGRFTMREAWIFMEASTGEWKADGDNSAMVVFFSLFGDKNRNVGGIEQWQMD